MKKLTALLLVIWVGDASACGIWQEEIYDWIIRFYIMMVGGQWN